MKKLLGLCLILVTTQAFAAKYYQGQGGAIKEITAAEFDACAKIYYRNAAKADLSPDHQKGVVKASLKGELVNDLAVASAKLKGEDKACSYGDNAEAF
jgi:hypothetical protein